MSAPPELVEVAEAVAKELSFGMYAPVVKLLAGALSSFTMSG